MEQQIDPQGLPSLKLIVGETKIETRSPAPVDLREVRVTEFLQARSLAANTEKAYRRELKKFLGWTDRPWAEITPRHLAQYKAHLKQERLSPNSINRALAGLMSFFDWFRTAYPEQMLQDPTTAVELERVPLPPAQDLSEAQVAALYLAVEQQGERAKRDRAVLSVLAHGLRVDEVVRLNVGDFDGIRLTIVQAKDDSTGTVPLARQARDHLLDYLSDRALQEGELAPKAPLFLSYGRNRRQQRLGYQGIYYLVKKLGQRAAQIARAILEGQDQGGSGEAWQTWNPAQLRQILELEQVHPHQLRHTFATGLLLRGMESLHARTLTRHRSEASFKRYAKRVLATTAEQAFYRAINEEPPG